MERRPDWVGYFFTICEVVSNRSHDPDTRVGAVIVDKQFRIVSVGYNGYLQGLDDASLPKTRPEKYYYMVHAEQNAVAFANKTLSNTELFVSAFPCNMCLKLLIAAGVKRIHYIERPVNMISEEEVAYNLHLCELKDIWIKGYRKEDVLCF